jgi:hypothetical protein
MQFALTHGCAEGSFSDSVRLGFEMKHSSKSKNWLCFVLSVAASALLLGCDSDDGYVSDPTADAAVAVDAPVVKTSEGDAATLPMDAVLMAKDAGAHDAIAAVDALGTDALAPIDSGGDAGLMAPECDIYDTQSCPAANMKCDLARHPMTDQRYLACRNSGPKMVGEACTGGSQCGRGLVCINTVGMTTCRQVCDAKDGTPACTVSGQTCAGRSATYGVTFCL